MADKMMRVAGRGADGLAKAIRTDDYGSLSITSSDENRQEINLSLNYEGKQPGDTTKVLSRAETRYHSDASQPLSDGFEFTSEWYASIAKKDGTPSTINNSDSGMYSMNIYRFNLLGQLKKDGLLPSHVTAEKLKEYINRINLKVVAFGSSSTLSGFNIKVHRYDTGGSFWDVLQETTNNTLEEFNNQINTSYIDKDGFIIILLHPNGAGNGTVHSRLAVDYIELDVSIGMPVMQTRSVKLEEKADELIVALKEGGTLNVVDVNGGKVEGLSAEKDNDGKAVLRVIDAAPYAYDPISEAFSTVQKKKQSHKQINETQDGTVGIWGTSDLMVSTDSLAKVNAIGAFAPKVEGGTGEHSFVVTVGNFGGFDKPYRFFFLKEVDITEDLMITPMDVLNDITFSKGRNLYITYRVSSGVTTQTEAREFFVDYTEDGDVQ